MGATAPALTLCSTALARKRETQKFCLTPRLSLQLYYVPVLAPEVAGQGRGGRGGAGGAAWRGCPQHGSGLGAGQPHPWFLGRGWSFLGMQSREGPSRSGLCPNTPRRGPRRLNVPSWGGQLPIAEFCLAFLMEFIAGFSSNRGSHTHTHTARFLGSHKRKFEAVGAHRYLGGGGHTYPCNFAFLLPPSACSLGRIKFKAVPVSPLSRLVVTFQCPWQVALSRGYPSFTRRVKPTSLPMAEKRRPQEAQ